MSLSVIALGAGYFFSPILTRLATDAAGGMATDYIKKCFGRVFGTGGEAPALKAILQAHDQLLRHLETALYQHQEDDDLSGYTQTVEGFIRAEAVSTAIGRAFLNASVDEIAQYLDRAWWGLPSAKALPEGFRWKGVARSLLQSAKSIRENSKELRELLDHEALLKLAESSRRQSGPELGLDPERMQAAILKHYNRLVNLDCLALSAAYFQEMRLWDVFIPQDVRECREYIARALDIPKEHLRRMRERGEVEDGAEPSPEEVEELRQRYFEAQPRNVIELIDDASQDRLVILGDPGAGKSALMRYLALRWAELPVSQLGAAPMPLLVELRDYDHWNPKNGTQSLLHYWAESPGALVHFDETLLDQRLRQPGGSMLLLDGLDEIFDPGRREDAVREILRFADEYPRIPFIVTSRSIGFKEGPLRDGGFGIHMLQDFDPERIEEFLVKWHERAFADAEDGTRKLERLRRSLQEFPRIAELAANPLLLTMMAIVNRRQELPRGRAKLYEECSKVLLDLWDTERLIQSHPELKGKGIDLDDKQAMLHAAAYRMQTAPVGEAGNLIPEDDLVTIFMDYLKNERGIADPKPIAKTLVTQLRERNFTLCHAGASHYAFVHRTFLEYYCASQVVYRFSKKRDLTEDELIKNVFGLHWNDDAWRETLCLVAGQLDESVIGKAIDHLLSQPQPDRDDYQFRQVFLAADLFREARSPMKLRGREDRLRGKLEELSRFEYPFAYERWSLEEFGLSSHRTEIVKRAIEMAANYFLPRHEAKTMMLERASTDSDWAVRAVLMNNLSSGWKDDAEIFLFLRTRITSDEESIVRSACVDALARDWLENPDALRFLKENALKSDDAGVRSAAVQAIARIDNDGHETFTILKNILEKDDDSDVHCSVIRSIAKFFKKHPETVKLLRECARTSSDGFIGSAAVHALASGWKDDPDTLGLIKELACSAISGFTRQAAVEVLADGWKDDPEAIGIVLERARIDHAGFVVGSAVERLVRNRRCESEALAILKQRARSSRGSVRSAVGDSLAKHFKGDPEAYSILVAQSRKDDDWHVRIMAIHHLASAWRNDPRLLSVGEEWLKDSNPIVRNAAITSLAAYWKANPKISALLKERARTDENVNVRRAAVMGLARGWKADPEVLISVKQCARMDKNEEVRRAAIFSLARGWKDDPELTVLLKERARSDEDESVRSAAVECLSRGWKDDSEVQQFLRELKGKS